MRACAQGWEIPSIFYTLWHFPHSSRKMKLQTQQVLWKKKKVKEKMLF